MISKGVTDGERLYVMGLKAPLQPRLFAIGRRRTR